MTDSASPAVRFAGCVCGRVRIRVEGEPYRVGLCHCLDCRKTHAAPFKAFAVFPTARVTVTAASGTGLGIQELGGFNVSSEDRQFFCTTCGSHLFGQENGSDEIELHLGSFDEVDAWAPTYETWVKRRESCLGELPTIRHRYVENRTGAQRYENE